MARPQTQFEVAHADREVLESWLRASNTKRSRADRARIVLLLADGVATTTVAERLGTSTPTVCKWRRRYIESGVSGLADRPRSGKPTVITDDKVKRILDLTVHHIPREATHWSIRLMAKYAGVSTHVVRKVWKAADLKPHRLRSFKISNDPHFADKVIDVVGLYVHPPDNALVLSVDEKTQIQALDRTQPMLPLRPGQVERRTHDYKRHGTTSVYAAFDIASGEVLARITKRHRAKEFLAFLRQIDRFTEPKLAIHLILDNSSTHNTAEVRRWLQKHPRYTLHFTPTSASWLNAVESWFSQLERRAIYRNAFTSVKALREEIRRFVNMHNEENARPFKWTETAEAILAKVDRVKATQH